ncbi:MAG TPA: rRNA maturation RNase YbeY [Afifellaceae bacterium]|nr:rRNA maturation RNase YbeY [Afifellaceae bacterium]
MSDAPAPEIDVIVEAGAWPDPSAIEALAARAIAAAAQAASRSLAGQEVSIVLTDDAAIQRLNARWRGRDLPTNVLSFPQSGGPLLGDIVLACETVAKEAAIARRPLDHHIAHLVVHGCLHLLGYDHDADAEAERMEDLERAALSAIGVPDPYARAPMER